MARKTTPALKDPRDDVQVYVHTCPARRDTVGATLASLDASDAAGRYIVIEHPDGVPAQQFYVDALRQAVASGKRWVVRIEDDAEVNKHLLHNVLSWAALRDPAFGMGFLSNANNWTPRFEIDDLGCYRALSEDVSAAIGQVWRADFVPEFVAALRAGTQHAEALAAGRINYDNAMSKACGAIDRNVYVHFPALVRENEGGREHSTWGNRGPNRHPMQPDFAPTWKRERRIPKIIHQIWIGDLPAPAALMQTWRDLNPTWEYRLWTSAEGWKTQAAIDAVVAMHGKADLMRYEILADHGGFFIDADAECVAPLPDWLCEFAAFTCWESETHRPGIVANGYMACAPGDPAVVEIRERTGLVVESGDPDCVWKAIGSGLWSDVLRKHGHVHIFPARMFIPQHFTGAQAQGDCPVFAQQYWGSSRGYAGIDERRAPVPDPIPWTARRGLAPVQLTKPGAAFGDAPSLSICIASLSERSAQLDALCAKLRAMPGADRVEILTAVDDGAMPVYAKRNNLLQRARGLYVCAVDDDDDLSASYLPVILAAIDAGAGADAVVFRAERTRDDDGPTVALDYYIGAAPEADGTDWRTPDHLTPVRADLAKRVPFPAQLDNEDVAWRKALLPLLKRIVRAGSGPLYFYRWSPSKPKRQHRIDAPGAQRSPPPEGAITVQIRKHGNGFSATVPHGAHYFTTSINEDAARQKALTWCERNFPGAPVAML